MFKRIIYDDWMTIVPVIAFGIMFTVFIVSTIRALRIRPTERERLSSLPLDEQPGNKP
ncbi:hypothetical protein [Haloferula sargassicola]|uniref:Cbb3-type cytochrome c oxidase subunit 3 n=1 Tax=Haloferula sargassicola TaxID=490096 RepID=A0ABP9USL7_9BACT